MLFLAVQVGVQQLAAARVCACARVAASVQAQRAQCCASSNEPGLSRIEPISWVTPTVGLTDVP